MSTDARAHTWRQSTAAAQIVKSLLYSDISRKKSQARTFENFEGGNSTLPPVCQVGVPHHIVKHTKIPTFFFVTFHCKHTKALTFCTGWELHFLLSVERASRQRIPALLCNQVEFKLF